MSRAVRENAGKDKAALIEAAVDENIKLVTAALRKQPLLSDRIKEGRSESSVSSRTSMTAP